MFSHKIVFLKKYNFFNVFTKWSKNIRCWPVFGKYYGEKLLYDTDKLGVRSLVCGGGGCNDAFVDDRLLTPLLKPAMHTRNLFQEEFPYISPLTSPKTL